MGWSHQDLMAAPASWIPIILDQIRREAQAIAKATGQEGDDG